MRLPLICIHRFHIIYHMPPQPPSPHQHKAPIAKTFVSLMLLAIIFSLTFGYSWYRYLHSPSKQFTDHINQQQLRPSDIDILYDSRYMYDRDDGLIVGMIYDEPARQRILQSHPYRDCPHSCTGWLPHTETAQSQRWNLLQPEHLLTYIQEQHWLNRTPLYAARTAALKMIAQQAMGQESRCSARFVPKQYLAPAGWVYDKTMTDLMCLSPTTGAFVYLVPA